MFISGVRNKVFLASCAQENYIIMETYWRTFCFYIIFYRKFCCIRILIGKKEKVRKCSLNELRRKNV